MAPLRATTATLVRLVLFTKTVNAVAVLQLAAEHRLKLSDTVEQACRGCRVERRAPTAAP
ncbi:hypothetical protein [Streptomyces griseorubiginosus]|uniref:hypothetical protein n=1 Tax=Streptomyces griseorubiginosus TaxID=67304 RepID=UPI00365851E1